MYGDKAVDKPDWLPDDPTSGEASQMVLNQSETLEQAQITAYMSGYFDGEGCIQLNVDKTESYNINYRLRPRILVASSQMAGLFDAEGSIELSPREHSDATFNYLIEPRLRMTQVQDKTMLEDICDSYREYFDFYYSVSKRQNIAQYQPTVQIRVSQYDSIRNFLAPLLPMLKEKQEQAIIMLREIIPRLENDVHLTKEGFIELMKWKELLDREKPMGNEDRKYTVEYFEDLWADDLDDDAQSDLVQFAQS